MASGKIDSLWVELGVKGVGQSTLKDFIKDVGSIKMTSLAAGGALATLFGMIGESTSAAISFQTFKNATALSTDELQLWQNAAVLANDSAEGMTEAITTLQSRLQAIKMGKYDEAFAMLGVTPDNPAGTIETLHKIMARRGSMPTADYSAFVGRLGAGRILNTLAAGESGLARSRGIGIMSAAQIKANLDFMLQFKTLWLEIRVIARDVATAALPGLEYIMSGYQKIVDFYNDQKKSKEGVDVGGLFNYYFRAFEKPPRPAGRGATQTAAPAASNAKGVVTVYLTGDRADVGLALKIAEEIRRAGGLAADQIPVESPDNYTIPGKNGEYTIPGVPK